MQQNIAVKLLSSDNSLLTDKTKNDFFEKHNVKKRFDIISLPSLANVLKGSTFRPLNWLETMAVNISILRYVLSYRNTFDILYYRDCSLFLPILAVKYILNKPLFLELHAVLHKKHGQFLNNFFSKISNGLIAITYGLKDYYEKFNSNIIVAFCAAAEPDRFTLVKEDKETLRKELKLPSNKIILMYAGNLYKTGNNDSYDVEDIIHAMAYVDNSMIFIGIGKKANETKGHEELARQLNIESKIVFLPWMSRQEVYRYWKAADILIHPAAGAQIGNSPTKIFEYLASGNPIISAGTTPIEEILHDNENAVLVSNYKDPHEWVIAIDKVLKDKVLRNHLIETALEDSKKYTWLDRGQLVAEFICQSIS
jgi:glycosyltransferase involved in cell wall biosynthesis